MEEGLKEPNQMLTVGEADPHNAEEAGGAAPGGCGAKVEPDCSIAGALVS